MPCGHRNAGALKKIKKPAPILGAGFVKELDKY
jgi:hypothetical protein